MKHIIINKRKYNHIYQKENIKEIPKCKKIKNYLTYCFTLPLMTADAP